MALLRGSSPVYVRHRGLWPSPALVCIVDLSHLRPLLFARRGCGVALHNGLHYWPRLPSRSESRTSQRRTPLRKHTACAFGVAPGGARPLVNPAGYRMPHRSLSVSPMGQTLRRFSGLRFATSLASKCSLAVRCQRAISRRLLLLTTAVQWLVPLQARPRTRAFASSHGRHAKSCTMVVLRTIHLQV